MVPASLIALVFVTTATAEISLPPNGVSRDRQDYCDNNTDLHRQGFPSNVGRGESPWRCRVLHGNNVSCTCSILSSDWVLTYSHCFNGNNYSDNETVNINVFAGGVDENDWTQERTAHLYSQPNAPSAVLLKLAQPFIMDGTNVRVIDLYRKRHITYKQGTGSGYGYHCNESSRVLWKINLEIRPPQVCFPDYHDEDYFNPSPRVVCAWTPHPLYLGQQFCKDGYKEFLDYYDPVSGKPYLLGIYAGNGTQDCDWQQEYLRYNVLNDYVLAWILQTIGSDDLIGSHSGHCPLWQDIFIIAILAFVFAAVVYGMVLWCAFLCARCQTKGKNAFSTRY